MGEIFANVNKTVLIAVSQWKLTQNRSNGNLINERGQKLLYHFVVIKSKVLQTERDMEYALKICRE